MKNIHKKSLDKGKTKIRTSWLCFSKLLFYCLTFGPVGGDVMLTIQNNDCHTDERISIRCIGHTLIKSLTQLINLSL